MIDEHEEEVLIYTMASQINEVFDSLAQNSIFQSEVRKLLQDVLDNQNILRQELFILRTNGKTNSPQVSESESIISKSNVKVTKETINVPDRRTFSQVVITEPRSSQQEKK